MFTLLGCSFDYWLSIVLDPVLDPHSLMFSYDLMMRQAVKRQASRLHLGLIVSTNASSAYQFYATISPHLVYLSIPSPFTVAAPELLSSGHTFIVDCAVVKLIPVSDFRPPWISISDPSFISLSWRGLPFSFHFSVASCLSLISFYFGR